MADIDNPAGRLYDLLIAYTRATNSASMAQAWGSVFGVPENEVAFELGKVGGLLLEVRDAALADPSGVYEPLPEHLSNFTRCVFPTTNPLNDKAVNAQPDGHGMHLLRAFALHLHHVAPEGSIPDAAELDGLRDDVNELQTAVRASALPEQVKRAILTRLTQVLQALDELGIGGPGAIRSAAEALAGAFVVSPEATEDKSLVAKVANFVTKAVAAVAVANTASGDLLGLGAHIQLLLSGTPQAQLPPGDTE